MSDTFEDQQAQWRREKADLRSVVEWQHAQIVVLKQRLAVAEAWPTTQQVVQRMTGEGDRITIDHWGIPAPLLLMAMKKAGAR